MPTAATCSTPSSAITSAVAGTAEHIFAHLQQFPRGLASATSRRPAAARDRPQRWQICELPSCRCGRRIGGWEAKAPPRARARTVDSRIRRPELEEPHDPELDDDPGR